MKDAKGARQQSSFKHNNWRQMHYKRIIYNDMVLSFDFTKTQLSQTQENYIAKTRTPLFYELFDKIKKKHPYEPNFVITRTLPNNKQFICVCFND